MAKTKVQHLVPYFDLIVGQLLNTNTTIKDSHYMIEEFKNRFPQIYLNNMQLFQHVQHGVERAYHSSLAKLIKHSVAHTKHIGNVSSKNCHGYNSINAQWYIS